MATLDEQGRKDRARKAANVAAKNRRTRNISRDKNIVRAFLFLTPGAPQSSKDRQLALQYLDSLGRGLSPAPDESVYRFLSDVTGLSKMQIRRITQEVKKQLISSCAAETLEFPINE